MNKREVFFLSAFMLLLGTVIGFLCSPVKHGLNIGNHSGNSYYGNEDDCCDEWDYDKEEDDLPF